MMNTNNSWLYLKELSSQQEERILDYINSYLKAYKNYLLNSSIENSLRLQMLSGPIDEIYNVNNPRLINGEIFPAVELIKQKIDMQGKEIEEDFSTNTNEKDYIRALKTHVGHPLNDDIQMEKNAYWQAPLIIIITVIVGIILGAILFFIK